MSSEEMPPPPPSSPWKYLASSASTKLSSLKEQYMNSSSSQAVLSSLRNSRFGNVTSGLTGRNALKLAVQGTAATGFGDASGNINQEGERQSWRTWAGQKMRLRRGTNDGNSRAGLETLSLFPGWAVRRYRSTGMDEAFEVEVYISGYAVTQRSLETASRSQRAFIRLAKGFASLPKITADVLEPESPAEPEPVPQLTPSTEELLAQKALPPRPTEITEDYEIHALERQFQRANNMSDSISNIDSTLTTPVSSESTSSRSSSVDSDSTPAPNDPTRVHQRVLGDEQDTEAERVHRGSGGGRNPVTSIPADVLRKLHANLETRLQPFWSSVLASRTIRLHLFASPHQYPQPHHEGASLEQDYLDVNDNENENEKNAVGYGPVAVQDVTTAADGSFQARFVVKWEDLCQHPGALHIAFGDRFVEHDLLLSAQVLPLPNSGSGSGSGSVSASRNPSPSSSVSDLDETRQQSYVGGESNTVAPSPSSPLPTKSIRIAITHSPLRVISDIDDTVKHSGVLNGARAVFHNVFVKELAENVIPGMGEWYTAMWKKGVRFHYVSNGPFELLPVINDFFKISQLPPGSIRLKSYAGRSIFNGLLSAPAIRKRAGVLDILNAFPKSRFILIGDSGEQDLELYSEVAKERPNQILAVFIRDVENGEPIDDPTGWRAIGARSIDDIIIRPRRTLSDLWSGSGSSSNKSSPVPTPRSITPISEHGNEYFTSEPVSAEPEPIRTMSTPLASAPGFLSVNIGQVKPFPSPSSPSKSSSGLLQPHSASAAVTGRPPRLDKLPIRASSDGSTIDVRSRSPASTVSTSSQQRLSEAEKKRYALQVRVYGARMQMPAHVPLRVFRDPVECVEAEEVIEKRDGIMDV